MNTLYADDPAEPTVVVSELTTSAGIVLQLEVPLPSDAMVISSESGEPIYFSEFLRGAPQGPKSAPGRTWLKREQVEPLAAALNAWLAR